MACVFPIRSSVFNVKRLLGAVAVTAVMMGSLAAASADVVPPGGCGSSTDVAPCDGKKAGDACTFTNGSKGSCAALRCTNDAGQALLQCVATGVAPATGCSALPAAAATTSGAVMGGSFLLLALGASLRRRRRK